MNEQTAQTAQTAQNIATVQAVYEAFGRGDVPAILSRLDDDVVWEQDGESWGIPWYEPRQGIAEIPGFFSALMNGLIIHKLEPRNILSGGNQVAVVMDLEAEVNGSGRRLQELEIHLWTFGEDGKVTRFAHVLDRHPQLLAYQAVAV